MLTVCVCVFAVVAAAGVSKAQGTDQTSNHQQRAPVRERDPSSQTTGLQQGYKALSRN